MYTLECEAVLSAPIDDLWRVWTDIDRLAEWDPREEARLDGPFAVGTRGYSKQKGNPEARSPSWPWKLAAPGW